jgi:adenosine deaminase
LLPKVELPCHVEGTLRPGTVVELAAKHGIALPTTRVDEVYRYSTIYEFLENYRTVNSTVIDREDFARIAYETLQDGVELGKPEVPGDALQPHAAHGVGHSDGHRDRRVDRRCQSG